MVEALRVGGPCAHGSADGTSALLSRGRESRLGDTSRASAAAAGHPRCRFAAAPNCARETVHTHVGERTGFTHRPQRLAVGPPVRHKASMELPAQPCRNDCLQRIGLPFRRLPVRSPDGDPAEPLSDTPDMGIDRKAIPLERRHGGDDARRLEGDAGQGHELRLQFCVGEMAQAPQAGLPRGHGAGQRPNLSRARRSEPARMHRPPDCCRPREAQSAWRRPPAPQGSQRSRRLLQRRLCRQQHIHRAIEDVLWIAMPRKAKLPGQAIKHQFGVWDQLLASQSFAWPRPRPTRACGSDRSSCRRTGLALRFRSRRRPRRDPGEGAAARGS